MTPDPFPSEPIRAAITFSYGDTKMAHALADTIIQDLPTMDERAVMRRCWMWFPGGATAAFTARKIMEATRA